MCELWTALGWCATGLQSRIDDAKFEGVLRERRECSM